MNDTITISDIELWTRLGVPAAERSVEQRVLVTLELQANAKKIAGTDDVRKGIDYERVVNSMRTVAAKERKTLERLAEDISASILRNYKPKSVRVTITKFPFPGSSGVSLTITRP